MTTTGRTGLIKSLYVQSRRPGVTPDEFTRLWREHGTMAMMVRDYFHAVRRYVQADVLQHLPREPSQSGGYDGVGELCFASTGDRDAANASAGRAEVILPHGQALFGSPRPISLVLEEAVVHRAHNGAIKLYVFLKRQANDSRDDFLSRWQGAHRQAVQATRPFAALVRSFVQSRSLEAGSAFDGVDELTFDRVEDLVETCATLEAEQFSASRGLFCDQAATIRLMTRQVVMYEARDDTAWPELSTIYKTENTHA